MMITICNHHLTQTSRLNFRLQCEDKHKLNLYILMAVRCLIE